MKIQIFFFFFFFFFFLGGGGGGGGGSGWGGGQGGCELRSEDIQKKKNFVGGGVELGGGGVRVDVNGEVKLL